MRTRIVITEHNGMIEDIFCDDHEDFEFIRVNKDCDGELDENDEPVEAVAEYWESGPMLAMTSDSPRRHPPIGRGLDSQSTAASAEPYITHEDHMERMRQEQRQQV